MNITTLRQEVLYLLCKYGLISKKKHWHSSAFTLISYDEIVEVNKKNCSSNIFVLKKADNIFYFRECGVNGSKQDCLESIIRQYQENASHTDFCLFVRKTLSIPKNFNLFWRMGQLNDKNSAIYNFYKTSDSSIIGLPDENKVFLFDIKKFVSYAWSEIMTCRYNQGGGNYRMFGYNRAKAQSIIAQHLGLEKLICSIELGKIERNGRLLLGSLMLQAPGIDPNVLNKNDLVNCVSPKLLSSLISLNLLDAICNEKDHRPGNYNVILDKKGKGVSVVAFDNDSPFAFFPTIKANMTSYFGSSSMIDSKGCINRVGLDAKLADRILKLNFDILLLDLKPYLNSIQRITLKRRIINLQKSLVKTIRVNKSFLKQSEEWNDTDVLEDLSGRYGRTYLYILSHWQELYGNYSKHKQIFINDI